MSILDIALGVALGALIAETVGRVVLFALSFVVAYRKARALNDARGELLKQAETRREYERARGDTSGGYR